MTSRRRYTAGERAVCTVGVLAGKSLPEINEQLRQDAERSGGTLRTLPESSHEMLRRAYAPDIAAGATTGTWQKMWDHITAPKSLGEL
jgi:hypothetical protein